MNAYNSYTLSFAKLNLCNCCVGFTAALQLARTRCTCTCYATRLQSSWQCWRSGPSKLCQQLTRGLASEPKSSTRMTRRREYVQSGLHISWRSHAPDQNSLSFAMAVQAAKLEEFLFGAAGTDATSIFSTRKDGSLSEDEEDGTLHAVGWCWCVPCPQVVRCVDVCGDLHESTGS